MPQIRPPEMRRSWLFVGGADEAALIAAADSGADVLIHELEDFTAPSSRPAAREIAPRTRRLEGAWLCRLCASIRWRATAATIWMRLCMARLML